MSHHTAKLREESAAKRLDNRVYAYFKAPRVTVAQTFTPGAGWFDWTRYRKTVTHSWLRKLRRDGVAAVALTDGHRTADFTIAELLAR